MFVLYGLVKEARMVAPIPTISLTTWQHDAIDIGTRAVAIAAFLHTALPPWDWDPEFVKVGLVEFPKLQAAFYKPFRNRYYKLLIYICGYIALHARSTVWQSISMKNQMSNGGIK